MLRTYGTDPPVPQPILTPGDVVAAPGDGRPHPRRARPLDYAVALTHFTRSHPKVTLGCSPRATLGLVQAGKAFALMEGRPFLDPRRPPRRRAERPRAPSRAPRRARRKRRRAAADHRRGAREGELPPPGASALSVEPSARPRARHVAIGDPQAPLETFFALLDAHGLRDDDGRVAPDVHLVVMGDYFDWGARDDRERARQSGRRLLEWLAAHPREQVTLLLGNHDLARVGELRPPGRRHVPPRPGRGGSAYLEKRPVRPGASLGRDRARLVGDGRARLRDLRHGAARARRSPPPRRAVRRRVCPGPGPPAHARRRDAGPARRLGLDPQATLDARAIAEALGRALDDAVAAWKGGPFAIPGLHEPGDAAARGRHVLPSPRGPSRTSPGRARGTGVAVASPAASTCARCRPGRGRPSATSATPSAASCSALHRPTHHPRGRSTTSWSRRAAPRTRAASPHPSPTTPRPSSSSTGACSMPTRARLRPRRTRPCGAREAAHHRGIVLATTAPPREPLPDPRHVPRRHRRHRDHRRRGLAPPPAPAAFGSAVVLAIALGRGLSLLSDRLRQAGFEMVWGGSARVVRLARGETLCSAELPQSRERARPRGGAPRDGVVDSCGRVAAWDRGFAAGMERAGAVRWCPRARIR